MCLAHTLGINFHAAIGPATAACAISLELASVGPEGWTCLNLNEVLLCHLYPFLCLLYWLSGQSLIEALPHNLARILKGTHQSEYGEHDPGRPGPSSPFPLPC